MKRFARHRPIDRDIRIIESFVNPTARTNPYVTQLWQTLRATPGIEVRPWSWARALCGRYNVLHAHWTEALLERRGGRLHTAARHVLFAAVVLRMRLTGVRVVRTMHNLELPTGISRTEVALLKAVDRLTAVQIVLSEFTPAMRSGKRVLIEHGHYRDWFARYPHPKAVPGRIAFVGKVRRYKNVEGLVRAFRDLQDSEPYSLHVAGSPSSDDLQASITDAASTDARIDLRFAFLDDADLVREVAEAEIVVLAYHEMHNSGSVLAALSLDRPVLVPDNEVNRALAEEVGEGWVLTFTGELDADDIRSALERSRRREPGSRPDLNRRGWSEAGVRHREAFREALATRRKRRR